MLLSRGKRREREGDEEDHLSSLLLRSIMENFVISPMTTAIDEKGSSLVVKTGKAKLGRIESIQKERDRREKMTEMFSVLQSIVPNIFPKDKRESIVAETIQYIQRLEGEKDRLETLKKSRESTVAAKPTLTRCTKRNRKNSAVNVTISANNGIAFFGLQTAVSRRSLAVEIFGVFEKHGAEVLAASVSIHGGGHQEGRLDFTVTAFVGGNGDIVEKIKSELLSL